MSTDVPTQPDWETLASLIQEADEEAASIYDELCRVDIRYLRVEPHNEGGMKVILRTHDAMTGRPMAMAKLKADPTTPATPAAIENFLREARITAHLEHSNIVPVYDIGLDDESQPYFTMKLLGGENLSRILDKLRAGDPETRARYTRPALVDLFLKICDAIAYAHDAGIIHLDLKPGNIHLSKYGEVLVCDWGLAKIVNSDCGSERSILDDTSLYNSCVNYLTVDGFFSGTPGYMAPEQAIGGRKRVNRDERTDIYSLGCLLYSMLTYECPIDGDDFDDVLARTRAGEFQAPRKRNPHNDIPNSLEAVVLKAMALDPVERYQSVQEISTDILTYRDGYATEAESAGFWTQFKLLLKRNPKVAWTVLAALLLLAFTTAVYTAELRQREKQALTNFEMYKKEREWRTNYEAAPDYYYEAFEAYKVGDFERAGQKVRIALDHDKRLFRAWELKGNVHFAQMDFEEASRAFANQETNEGDRLAKLSAKLAKVPKQGEDYSLKQAEQILKLVEPLRRSQPVRQMLSTYLAQTDLELNDRMAFIESIWRADATKKTPLKCKVGFLPQGVSINLSNNKGPVDIRLLRGTPVLQLTWRNSVVTHKDLTNISKLPIKDLDLSSSRGFSHVDALHALPLESLNLAGTNVRNISGLKNMSIKTLDLRRIDVVDARWLQFLITGCEVGTVYLSEDLSRYAELVNRLMQVTEVNFVP